MSKSNKSNKILDGRFANAQALCHAMTSNAAVATNEGIGIVASITAIDFDIVMSGGRRTRWSLKSRECVNKDVYALPPAPPNLFDEGRSKPLSEEEVLREVGLAVGQPKPCERRFLVSGVANGVERFLTMSFGRLVWCADRHNATPMTYAEASDHAAKIAGGYESFRTIMHDSFSPVMAMVVDTMDEEPTK